MKDNYAKNKRTINYIFTSIGFIILALSIVLLVHDYRLEQQAVNIKATILSLNYKQGSYQATIKYKVGTETYRPTIKVTDNKYAVNDEIPIKYNINNPGTLIVTDKYFYYIPGFILSLLLLLFSLGKTIKNLKRSSNINHLKTKGIFIYANITEVFVDNKKRKYKGKYPYKLRCKYTNPIDNNEYIFESEESHLDFNEIFAKYNNQTIIVYLDKKNTSNYYVDLDSLLPHIELVDVGELMGDKKKPKPELPTEPTTEGENKDEEKDSTDKPEETKEKESQ